MSAASSVCSDDSFEIVNNELDVEEPEDEVFSVYKPKVSVGCVNTCFVILYFDPEVRRVKKFRSGEVSSAL